MTIVFDLIYLTLLLTVGWPYLIYRRLTRGPSRTTVAELLGRCPTRPVSGRCVWIHGVSLGEINATRTLIAELRRRSPTTVVVVSSTTRTGVERARSLYPHLLVFRFPIDFSFAVRRVLGRIRPTVLVLMELEVWPNLMELAAASEIPILIANGRVTAGRSMRLFRKPIIRSIARRMFRRVAFVGAQDELYAERFIELGVPAARVHVTGSVKYDGADVGDRVDGQDQLAADMGIDRRAPLLVAGSTGPGEEALLLDAYERLLSQFPTLQIALVPRKPERFDEVAGLINSRGFTCLRRSTNAPQSAPGAAPERHVYLGDTMGELRKFYALCDAAFVGRSLVPMGGSDVMEAAGLGKPVLIGPFHENFREPVEILTAAGGCVVVRDAAELARETAALLADRERAGRMGASARQAIISRQGATALTVDRILEFDQQYVSAV